MTLQPAHRIESPGFTPTENLLARIHSALLWDSSASPQTGERSPRAKRSWWLAGLVRKVAMQLEEDRLDGEREDDTFAQWLFCRMNLARQGAWEALSQEDRDYWAHEAAATRRAAMRGGFLNPREA